MIVACLMTSAITTTIIGIAVGMFEYPNDCKFGTGIIAVAALLFLITFAFSLGNHFK